jgi:hypothetical protein
VVQLSNLDSSAAERLWVVGRAEIFREQLPNRAMEAFRCAGKAELND